MPERFDSDNKQQHSFGAGRIRRAGPSGPDGAAPGGSQVFDWENEASHSGPAQSARPAQPRPSAVPKDGRASLFSGENPVQPSVFDYDGASSPNVPPAPGRQSLFDYEQGEHLPPAAPSPGYTEHFLAGGPARQAPYGDAYGGQAPARGVFDFEQEVSGYQQEAGGPRQPSRMREEHIELQAPMRQRPQGEEPRRRMQEQRLDLQAPARQSTPRAEALPHRKATVFDDLNEAPPQRNEEPRHGHAANQGQAWRADSSGGAVPPPRGRKARAAMLPQNAAGGVPPRKKRRRWPVVLLVILLLLGTTGVLAMHYIGNNLLDPGVFGRIVPNPDIPPTPYSKRDVLHLLIVGIDYEEGRSYSEGLGLTDMILYCRYDIKNNKMNMLQIPRDSYVGESLPTGGTGKINALLISGENKESPINNLAGPLQSMLQLPVDNYIAMDMDALKTIVDTFGGIQVYVPQEMSYDGSYLAQGWQTLDGNAAEFFVRNRHGEGFNRGDIDRLDNQRHFYSALFRRLLNMTPGDVANLFPVFDHYCNTDLSLQDITGLGVAALNLKAEDVLFAKVPGATDTALDPTGAGRSMYFVDRFGRGTEEEPGLAQLLNTYFRGEEAEAVPAADLQWPDINLDGATLYPPNVQGMAEVQTPEGGSDVDVEPKA